MKHISGTYAVLSIYFFIPPDAPLSLFAYAGKRGAFWFRCVNLPAQAAQIFLALGPLRPYNKDIE